MKEISVLIGGKAGDGINQSGLLIAHLLSRLGYFVYMYFDYPSLIRGGHNFAIVRASFNKILSHRDGVDYILAINQDTVDMHAYRLKERSNMLFDSSVVKSGGVGLPLAEIVKEENAKPIMRNSSLIGAFARCAGIDWKILDEVMRKSIAKETDLNLKLAQRGYNEAKELQRVELLKEGGGLPIVTGNEAIGLGLINAGLKAYVAYPMTPSSNLLHFLAKIADDFNLKVIHPESEIGVILMVLGLAYEGVRAAVGTSGGGFCLMTEGLSLAGMAELPIVIVVGQRPGPSTGLPTYTAQTELHFVLNAGQGEFVRLVVAPGDAEEAFCWSGAALNISWRYQIPSIILSDKTLSESAFSFRREEAGGVKEEIPLLWDRVKPYKRYSYTDSGVSPLAFVPEEEAVIKVNSYEHDEYGITTEDPKITTAMHKKRLCKEEGLVRELYNYEVLNVYGKKDAERAILCWGSNKGVCQEVGESLGLRVIQPLVLSPFPVRQFKESLKGVKRLIAVENNATGQLVRHINRYGFDVNDKILKYDGRPFSVEELEGEIRKR